MSPEKKEWLRDRHQQQLDEIEERRRQGIRLPNDYYINGTPFYLEDDNGTCSDTDG